MGSHTPPSPPPTPSPTIWGGREGTLGTWTPSDTMCPPHHQPPPPTPPWWWRARQAAGALRSTGPGPHSCALMHWLVDSNTGKKSSTVLKIRWPVYAVYYLAFVQNLMNNVANIRDGHPGAGWPPDSHTTNTTSPRYPWGAFPRARRPRLWASP